MRIINNLKKKMIAGIIVLVFVIQFTASAISYLQLRANIFETLQLEAETVSFPLMLQLQEKIANQSQSDSGIPPGILEIFVGVMGIEFGNLVEAQNKLLALQFVDHEGKILAHNQQEQVGQLIGHESLQKSQTQQIVVTELPHQIEIIVPFFYQDQYSGALIFYYSDDQMQEQSENILLTSSVIMGVFMLFGGLGAWLLALTLIARIKHVSLAIQNIVEGNGDLTRRLTIRSMDEVGELETWFNMFIDNVHQIIRSIEDEASVLTTVIEELSYTTEEMQKTTDNLAEITEEEDTRITDTASTIGTMAADLQLITQEVQQTAHNASLAEQNAEVGNQAVLHANQSMTKIEQSSQEIEGIIHVITEISNQTNLLSLNAAIEAAKASEYGKGFAVVADEIRSLAERSSRAVLEIQKLIESSSSNVSEGNTIIQETGDSLSEIIGQVREITQQVNSISQGIVQQDQAIHQISVSADGIRDMSENTAAIVAELSNATTQINTSTHELSKMSNRLMVQINQFKIR